MLFVCINGVNLTRNRTRTPVQAGPRTPWTASPVHFRATRKSTCSDLPDSAQITRNPAQRREQARSTDRFGGLEAHALSDGALLYVAGDRRSRARGLAGLERVAPEHALLLVACRSVHTIGMRFAIDLLWLDAAGRLIRLDAHVPPRRLRTCLRARAVIETGAGCGERFATGLASAPSA